MSVYLVKGKGWRYDFTMKGERYTDTWFKTKREAKDAESRRREELKKPQVQTEMPIDMEFSELVNKRLDSVLAYRCKGHYEHCVYMARRWVKRWVKEGESLKCSEISTNMVEQLILERRKISAETANREIRYLRATFNFGKKKGWFTVNPVDGIGCFPEEEKIKYVPPQGDIDKVIAIADPDTQDYLWTIRETFGRMGEINRLRWDDVDLEHRFVVLYTRKKKNGKLTPRKVPMTTKLFEILQRRHLVRDSSIPLVFWHAYTSSKTREKKVGQFQDRKKIMRTLCKRAGVKYFRFHALRHAGASLMDDSNVPIGAIQNILGHEKRTTTEIYLHRITPIERGAMDTYERARKNSHTNSHTEKDDGRGLAVSY